MANIIEVTDLPAAIRTGELIDALVAGANAKAARVAPCLTGSPSPTPGQRDEAKLVLIGAVRRWAEAGSGAVQQQTAGPFSMTTDNRQRTGYNLWPSEIKDLQDICKNADDGRRAFAVDTVGTGGYHSPICSIYFGSSTCSCGADLAGQPIYETG